MQPTDFFEIIKGLIWLLTPLHKLWVRLKGGNPFQCDVDAQIFDTCFEYEMKLVKTMDWRLEQIRRWKQEMIVRGRRFYSYQEVRQEKLVEAQRLEIVHEIELRRDSEVRVLLLERSRLGLSPEWSDYRLQYGHKFPPIARIDLGQ